MRFVTMFLPASSGHREYDGVKYLRVICDEEDAKILDEAGFVRFVGDLCKSPEVSIDPEKGDGAVGSFEWHKTQVFSFDSKDAVEDYTKQVTGIDIDKRGKILTVKKKAVEALEEWQRQQEQ